MDNIQKLLVLRLSIVLSSSAELEQALKAFACITHRTGNWDNGMLTSRSLGDYDVLAFLQMDAVGFFELFTKAFHKLSWTKTIEVVALVITCAI